MEQIHSCSRKNHKDRGYQEHLKDQSCDQREQKKMKVAHLNQNQLDLDQKHQNTSHLDCCNSLTQEEEACKDCLHNYFVTERSVSIARRRNVIHFRISTWIFQCVALPFVSESVSLPVSKLSFFFSVLSFSISVIS